MSTVDKNCLKSLIQKARADELLFHTIMPCEKNSLREAIEALKKFVDAKHDYVITVIRKC
jgi:hypothetical protein